MTSIGLCLLLVLSSIGVAHASPVNSDKDQTKEKTRQSSDKEKRPADAPVRDSLTTEVWKEPTPPLDLHWHFLALPEYIVELAFAPVSVLVTTVERYRLDLRVYDLLRNDAGTVVVGPKLKISGADGLGIGVGLSLNRLYGRDFYVKFAALYRLNGDTELAVQYQRNVPWLEGRSLEFGIDYEANANLPFFGIGEDSSSEKQVLREEFIDTHLTLDRSGKGILALSGSTQIGFRRSKLGVGSDVSALGVGEDPANPLLPPPGFGSTTNLPYLRFIVRVDSRDSSGRPSKGWLSQLEASFAKDFGSAKLSSMSTQLAVSRFIPVLPDRRVLRLRGGLSMSRPISQGDSIPLHELVTLGRRNFLRGYSTARFRDRWGWWAGAEYRFPIWEYLNTGVALSPTLFVDVGGVSSTSLTLFDSAPNYSYGIGLRGAEDTKRLLNIEFALSPEGSRFALTLGKDF